jgi:ABC-type phosphate transport system ATPase subunit
MNTTKLIGRSNEEKIIRECLSKSINYSELIWIFGDSGCGKTFFVKNIIGEIISEQDVYACYVNIDSDEMTSTSLFEILTYLSWDEHLYSSKSILSVPLTASYSKFVRKSKFSRQAQNNILSALKNSLSLIPVYGDIAKNFITIENNNYDFSGQQIENLYYAYIKKIASKRKVILILDNYQFIDERMRVRIEARFGEIKENVCLVIIERTINNKSKIGDPICYELHQTQIELKNFDATLTSEYLNNILLDCTADLSNHFYRLTRGNPKELELAVLNYKQGFYDNRNFILNSKNLIETINMLTEIEKYIIVITALFPSGMKLNYIADIIKRNLIVDSENVITDNINTLRVLGYITVNSSSGDLIKPAHEKIIISIKQLINDENYLEVYSNLLLSLEEIIVSSAMGKNELYLLNCLIGLFTAKQLREKISCVIRAITINYQQCLYNYIVLLYPEIKEVLSVLPEDCIIKILDSFQKTSNFYDGLEIISLLSKSGGLFAEYKLYYAKFLTQTYQFSEALKNLKEMENTDSVILYTMIIYQHLGNDTKVKELLSILLERNENTNFFSDDFYIALRNTAQFFPYEKAMSNLIKVNEHFKRKGFIFGEATANNNLGVIYLWAGKLNDSNRVLLRAYSILESINSNELFEVQINLGVLSYLKSDYKTAINHIENAEKNVPKSLWMDSMIIFVNKILFQLADGRITALIAFDELSEQYSRSIMCPDPWVRFQVIYNIAAVAKLASKLPPEEPDKITEAKFKSKDYPRFDIITSLSVGENSTDISLSLSPNWRY